MRDIETKGRKPLYAEGCIPMVPVRLRRDGKVDPSGFGMMPVLLRHHVRHILAGHRATMESHRRGGAAVRIVFQRTFAEIAEVLEARLEVPGNADTRQVNHVLGTEANGILHDNGTVFPKRIVVIVAAVPPVVPPGGSMPELHRHGSVSIS